MLYFRNRTLVALALLSINACGSSTESPQLSSAFASRATPLVSAQHVNPFGQLYVADALATATRFRSQPAPTEPYT
jgi:hypothetical protein